MFERLCFMIFESLKYDQKYTYMFECEYRMTVYSNIHCYVQISVYFLEGSFVQLSATMV